MNLRAPGRVRPGILRALGAMERRLAADEPSTTQIPGAVPGTAASIVEAFPNVTLGELFADTTPVSIYDPSLDWLGLPSPEFTNWVMTREPEIWDAMPPTADFFGSPTFSQVQAHRLSLTIEQVRPWMPSDDGLVIDVGSFPFSAPVAMREFLGFGGRILATVNQHFDDVKEPLRRLGIDHAAVNLDPLVAVSTFLPGMTDSIPVPDASADLVLLGHVIEHLYHPVMLMREISRVLKPGGALVVTTDNAFMLHGLTSQLTGARYLHEPVEQTAAMLFEDWRRHVRFFTGDDLTAMADSVGLDTVETHHNEVLYASVPESVFPNPIVTMPAWQARILTAVPSLRNDVAITAVKR